jgi:large subunit ribosomal protein L3
MADKNHPRRGSLAYKPMKRAARMYPQIKLPEDDIAAGTVAGFAGYKAGMTRVLRIDDEQDSPTKGQEVADAVTVIECPPLTVYGVRAYEMTADGENPHVDWIADTLTDELERTVNVPDEGTDAEDTIADNLDELSDLRLLVHTQPWKSAVGKKKPEVFEVPIGGDDVATKWETAQDLVGQELSVSEIFDSGQYVDAIGTTKGKGFQGPVKRHGVKTLSHKTQKSSRKAGNIGPWHPDHTTWKIPQPGGKGVNTRTEHNKRILTIDDDVADVNPEGGFTNYGEIRDGNEYLLVKGSVPGPEKRLIMFRHAVRMDGYPENPEITHIKK